MKKNRLAASVFDHIDTLNTVAMLAVLLFVVGIGMFIWDLMQLPSTPTKQDALYSPTLGDRVMTLSLHVRFSIAIIAAALLGILGMLHAIKKQTQPNPHDTATYFSNYIEFFRALHADLKNNPTTLYSSAIRRTSDGDMPDASVKAYYDLHSTWLAENPSALAERLVPAVAATETDSRAQSMREFVKRNLESARRTGRLSLYEIQWNFDYPVVNFAILDRRVVYLAFLPRQGSPAGGKWLRIESPGVASFFLDGYYSELRAMGKALS